MYVIYTPEFQKGTPRGVGGGGSKIDSTVLTREFPFTNLIRHLISFNPLFLAKKILKYKIHYDNCIIASLQQNKYENL